jgi:hypothetical protein
MLTTLTARLVTAAAVEHAVDAATGDRGGGGKADSEGYNPFSGISPSFGPFNDILSSKVGMLLALVWVLAFCYCGFHMTLGFATIARGRVTRATDAIEEGKTTLMWSGAAVMGLALLPLVYGVLIK